MFVFRLFDISSNFVINSRKFLCSRTILKNKERRALLTSKTLVKLGIPLPPKKPLNPYLRYLESTRPKLVQSQPHLTPTNIVKYLAQEWSTYDPEKKKELQKEYLSDMQVYLEKYEKYKQNMTAEQIDLINSTKKKQKQANEFARLCEKKESLGRPRKPPTAFIKFMIQKKSEKSDNLKHKDWLKLVAKEWEALPELDKEKYREETKMALEKYKSDVIAWEEDMIRQGHIDVIRHKDVLNNKPSKRQTNKTAS